MTIREEALKRENRELRKVIEGLRAELFGVKGENLLLRGRNFYVEMALSAKGCDPSSAQADIDADFDQALQIVKNRGKSCSQS